MPVTQTDAKSAQKSIYLSKTEYLLEELGPTAAKDFACDIAPIAGAEAMMNIVKILDARDCKDEALSILNETCRSFSSDLKAHEVLGSRIRNILPVQNDVLTDTTCHTPIEECEYVTVVGNSFARSFANGTAFMPIMAGYGQNLCFLTPETTKVASRLIWNVISRVDPKSLVLLVLGNSDASAHAKNLFGTWQAVWDNELPSHDIVIRTAAKRYFSLVEEIRAKTNLNLVLFTAIPPLEPERKWMISAYNDEMFEYGRSFGVPVVDLTEEVAVPSTGLLKPEISSIPGNDHMSHDCIPLVMNELEDLGLLPEKGHLFEWDYMFRLPFDPEIESRIWCEPHAGNNINMVTRPKILLTQILERATHILIGHLIAQPGSDVLIVNGREGYIALETPLNCCAQITSIDAQFANVLMAHRISKLLRRTDIRFETAAHFNELGECLYDYIVLVMHEDDDSETCLSMIEDATKTARQKVLVVTPLDLASRLSALPSVEEVSEISLSNRFIKGYWSGARLISLAISERV